MLIARHRKDIEELMDRPEMPYADVDRSLSDLEWVNRWLGGRKALIPHLLPLLEDCSGFLDIACGSGDNLRCLSDEVKKLGRSVRLVGMDINDKVLQSARLRTAGYPDIEFIKGDALMLPFPNKSFDVVYSATFIHHLQPDDVVKALQEAARVSRFYVVVSDLIRSDVALIAVWILGRLAFNRISRRDGPASVRRAYTPWELEELVRQAGYQDYRLYKHLFYRMTVVEKCSEG